MFVTVKASVGLRGPTPSTRAYGLDLAWQTTTNAAVRVHFAHGFAGDQGGIGFTGRAYYQSAPFWNGGARYARVAARCNREVGSLARRAYRMLDSRINLTYQPKQWPWIRRFSPHINYSAYTDLNNKLETSRGHFHFFEIQEARGARFGTLSRPS